MSYRIIISLLLIISGISGIFACALPPDIIHEFRIDTASGGNARVHYTLMAWKNLHSEILEKISKETNISVHSGNLDKIYQRYLFAHSELYINDKKVDLIFLTGTIIPLQWSTDIASYNPESLIEMEFETDISSEIKNATTIRLEFKKEFFRDITSLIHAYIYTDIQKYGTQGSYIIGKDNMSYFPSSFAGKTYGFRNTLEEASTKNTFTLYIEPNIISREETPNQSTQNQSTQKKSWFKVGERLEEFFYKQSSTTFQLLGLLIAILAGMIHGLLPGHSKTLIGTYMIGNSKLEYREILTLVGSITFSHTIFIFILAIIVLALQQGLSTVSSYIITISAVGYILFGIYFYIKGTRSLHHIKHTSQQSLFKKNNITDPDCDCNTNIEKGNLGKTTLIGILAGCNPCIDALALFVFAITIGNAIYAFFMILFFSLGLGLMLGIIALGIKKSKILLQKKSQEFAEKISAHITIISGIGIMLMGTYILFN